MRSFHDFTVASALALAVTSCAAAPAVAADLATEETDQPLLEPEEEGGFHGLIVLGGGVQPDFDGAAEYAPVPHIYANLEAFGVALEIEGLEAALNLRPDAAFQFGPAVGYDMGRDGATNKVVDRLNKIDGAFEAGGFAAYQFQALLAQSDVFEVSAELMADVSGVHDGVSGSVTASYMIAATQRLRLGTDVSVGFASDSYMDTYFGVTKAGSARSGLPAYTASGGFKEVSLGVTASYNVTERWGIVGRAAYSRLLGDAADSPIVKQEGSPDQFMGGLGISYSF